MLLDVRNVLTGWGDQGLPSVHVVKSPTIPLSTSMETISLPRLLTPSIYSSMAAVIDEDEIIILVSHCFSIFFIPPFVGFVRTLNCL